MSPFKSANEKEEEYFLKQEAKKLKADAREKHASTEAEERKRLKELHYMRCPKCGMELTEITFRHVKIDKCFTCGGVWLDDGELEQVADREPAGGIFSRLYGLMQDED